MMRSLTIPRMHSHLGWKQHEVSHMTFFKEVPLRESAIAIKAEPLWLARILDV